MIIFYPINHWYCLRAEMVARDSSNILMIFLRTLRMKICLRLWLGTYMVHTVRFVNQNNYIKNVMAKLNYDSSVCVVVMEFKMKFETMKYRESAVNCFVNRGLSCNYALVFYSFSSLRWSWCIRNESRENIYWPHQHVK